MVMMVAKICFFIFNYFVYHDIRLTEKQLRINLNIKETKTAINSNYRHEASVLRNVPLHIIDLCTP